MAGLATERSYVAYANAERRRLLFARTSSPECRLPLFQRHKGADPPLPAQLSHPHSVVLAAAHLAHLKSAAHLYAHNLL
ncbi:hypothetical protein D3C85_1792370 [compost metagenome]